jgi:hypothetical protein
VDGVAGFTCVPAEPGPWRARPSGPVALAGRGGGKGGLGARRRVQAPPGFAISPT